MTYLISAKNVLMRRRLEIADSYATDVAALDEEVQPR
jgi:hypothetical protein